MPYLLELPAVQTGNTLEDVYAEKGYTIPGVKGAQCVSFVKAAIPRLLGKTTAMLVKATT